MHYWILPCFTACLRWAKEQNVQNCSKTQGNVKCSHLPLPIVQQTYFHEGVAVHLELSIKIIPLRVTVEIVYYFICRSSSIILLSEINLIFLA